MFNDNINSRLYYDQDYHDADLEPDTSISEKIVKLRYSTNAPVGFDGVHCIECNEEISASRQLLNLCRCLECQEDFEKRK